MRTYLLVYFLHFVCSLVYLNDLIFGQLAWLQFHFDESVHNSFDENLTIGVQKAILKEGVRFFHSIRERISTDRWLLFINEDDRETNKADEEDKKNSALVLLLQKETWQCYFHSFIGFRTVWVPILLPIIVLLRVSKDLIGLNYELKLVLRFLSIFL